MEVAGFVASGAVAAAHHLGWWCGLVGVRVRRCCWKGEEGDVADLAAVAGAVIGAAFGGLDSGHGVCFWE